MTRRTRPRPLGRAPAAEGKRTRAGIEAISAGLVHGLLMVLAFPGVGVWPLALLAGAPLLLLAERLAREPARSRVMGAMLAGVGTLPMWGFEHSWVASMTTAGLPPLALLLSVYPALIVWGIARARRRFGRLPLWAASGIVWGGVEFFRGSIAFDGYPWLLLGHPLIESSALALPARWIGAFGVSAMCAMVAGCFVTILLSTRRSGGHPRPLVIDPFVGLSLLGGVWLASSADRGRAPETAPRVVVGLVQTNLPQSVRGEWSGEDRVGTMRELIDLSERAAQEIAQRAPAFIAWPETMYPGYFLDPESLQVVRGLGEGATNFRDFVLGMSDAMHALVQRLGVPFVVGVSAFENLSIDVHTDGLRWNGARRFNSAIVLRPQGIGGRYDKLFLTPFGEVMPYISRWAALERLLASVGGHGMAFDLETGSVGEPLVVGEASGRDVLAATPICFEATVPRVVRRLVFRRGQRTADFILNITNDGWFAGSDRGRELHLIGARWRCVELATPMARAANTGITCVVDAFGRIDARIPSRTAGVLVHEIPLATGTTLYARIGDLFGWLSLAGAILLIVATYFGGGGNAIADGESRVPLRRARGRTDRHGQARAEDRHDNAGRRDPGRVRGARTDQPPPSG